MHPQWALHCQVGSRHIPRIDVLQVLPRTLSNVQHCAFIGVEHIAVVQGNNNFRLVKAFWGGER